MYPASPLVTSISYPHYKVNVQYVHYCIEGLIELFCCSKGNSTNFEDVSIQGSSSVSKAATYLYYNYRCSNDSLSY